MIRSPFLCAFAVLALSAAGCRCSDPVLVRKDACRDVPNVQPDNIAACDSASQCADHYSCNAVKGQEGLTCCVFQDRKCQTEADCCPGQTCPVDRKVCFDKFLSCESDADCGDKGDMICQLYSDVYGNSNRCRFKTCDATGGCPAGQSCFQGECMAALPCEGACPAGSACVPTINRCQDYTNPIGREQAACPVSCNAGFIATFQDARNIWDSCNLPPVKCVCAELPSLQSEDLGRHSSIAAQAGQALLVSAYDGQYGDLVLFRYDTQGVRQALEYVDGVPNATPRYGPSGARGGVVEPGEDVGRYTDVAVAGDKTYVSYYDVTNGDLKLAWRQGTGAWQKMRVDGAVADLGLYTSVAVDSAGLPGISYFQRGADAAFDATQCPGTAPVGPKAFITALKFAKATTATPSTAGDWTIKTIACQSRPTPACYGCTNTCADPGTGPACLVAATGCNPACDTNTEACVTVGATAQCAKKYNPSTLNDIPEGVGLFSSLAFNNQDALIAYMRRTSPPPVAGKAQPADGDLWGVRVGAQGTVSAPVLLDASGDTGFFPDVKVEPATRSVAVGYHDFSSRALKFYFAATFQTGVTPEVIDSGLGAAQSGDWNWVGTDSAVVFGGPGQVYAVYQDPTAGDLKWAQRTTTWQVKGALSSQGAVGFFADGVLESGKLFASHAKVHARLVSGEPHVDNSLLLSSTPAP